ncbi:DUF1697 domain-containing protein [Cohnella faecalis]|uniref:DUF1697 domain-containing protein n=1 Tax=Cohnella faecalis TaxID=2315694 RepID=A0A398CMH8_9BACL|nr:DUF1697 domain-containing protein [Cohnella faecalis]RIE01097.1 DUF1697 domain-containing protein [Cohnella faecalis]
MTIYAALLRGINVGGNHLVKMADLKKLFEGLGLARVQTYIQSGNVLFDSAEEEAPLRLRLERELEAACGFPIPVLLRTAAELRDIVANCPFPEEELAQAAANSKGETLYVSMLLEPPANDALERLRPYANEDDRFRDVGRDIHFLFGSGLSDSKLGNNLQKLKLPTTMRNWKTMNKLVALSGAMESE